MGDKSKISWTDATWNPVAGCSPVSPGCANCYAAEVAASLERRGIKKYLGTTKQVLDASGKLVRTNWTGLINVEDTALSKPLHWKKPRKIFVNSMSDLFHESLPVEFIDKVFAVMALCQQHTFQVITKRAERMREYFCDHAAGGRYVWEAGQKIEMPRGADKPNPGWPLPNVWLGVSIEDAEPERLERVRQLLSITAAVKFLSVEPLLREMTTLPLIWRKCNHEGCSRPGEYFGWNIYGKDFDMDSTYCPRCKYAMNEIGEIDWVIVGGESGPRFRECDVAWINSIAKRCQEAHVPVWVKQDCGKKNEQQGRIPDDVWNLKQFPEVNHERAL